MTKDKERDAWIQAFKRENPSRTKWNPTSSDRICSLHFVDGIPTNANHAYGLRTTRNKNPTPSFQTPITNKENMSRGR